MSDSLEVFVGRYGPAEDPGIHALVVDPATGTLRKAGAHAGIVNPSFVAVHPGGRHLYAVSETGRATEGRGGRVHALRIEREAGAIALASLGHRDTRGDHPCHLRLDAGGRWLVVSNYGTGNVVVYPIEPDGSLGEPASSVQHAGRGFDAARQEGPHVHSSVFSPDGRFLIVTDLGLDALVVYAFDRDTGVLEQHQRVPSPPGTGPRHAVFHPDGSHLFVVGELDNTLGVFAWRGGDLRPGPSLPTVPPEAPPSLAADVHVSRSGRHVYVSTRGHDSVSVFEFDASAGLHRLAVRPCGGSWPRGLGVVPDGRHLLVANQRSGELVALPVDASGGIGAPVAGVPIPQAACVAIVERPGDLTATTG